MDYKTDDDWFWAGDKDDPETIVRLRQTAEKIQNEARNAARNRLHWAWVDAARLGYGRENIAWGIFLAEYQAERKKIEDTPLGWRFV